MTKKTITYTIVALTFVLMVASYSGGEKQADLSDPKDVPETHTLSHLAKTYQPVVFSHQMHSLITEDCAVCHHHSGAGQTPPCSKCHGVSTGSKESGAPGLKDAYHRQCIGCHKKIEMGPTGCMDCHTKVTIEMPSGQQASQDVKDVPVKKATQDMPETFILSSLEKMYEPVVFSHAMHTEMAEDCATCHHHSEAGQTPACGECHGAPFNPENLNMPGLKGAYHLQCMSCHRDMGAPVGCTECHARKASPIKQKVD